MPNTNATIFSVKIIHQDQSNKFSQENLKKPSIEYGYIKYEVKGCGIFVHPWGGSYSLCMQRGWIVFLVAHQIFMTHSTIFPCHNVYCRNPPPPTKTKSIFQSIVMSDPQIIYSLKSHSNGLTTYPSVLVCFINLRGATSYLFLDTHSPCSFIAAVVWSTFWHCFTAS